MKDCNAFFKRFLQVSIINNTKNNESYEKTCHYSSGRSSYGRRRSGSGVCTGSQSDPIFEANVEALTRNEGGGFGPMCSQTGKSGNYRMKLCTDCDGPMGDYAMDYVAFCN